MPASAVASLTPAMAGMSGTCLGASGETVEDIAAALIDQICRWPGRGPAIAIVDTLSVTEVTANSYFFAGGGAILLSAGFAGSAGLASDFAASAAGWFMRSTLASVRSFAT